MWCWTLLGNLLLSIMQMDILSVLGRYEPVTAQVLCRAGCIKQVASADAFQGR